MLFGLMPRIGHCHQQMYRKYSMSNVNISASFGRFCKGVVKQDTIYIYIERGIYISMLAMIYIYRAVYISVLVSHGLQSAHLQAKCRTAPCNGAHRTAIGLCAWLTCVS